jgi:hypothetical protein
MTKVGEALMRKNKQSKGIFCLEGLWDNDLRKPSTVRPILELLRVNREIAHIYRDCATREEFEYYIQRWTQPRYKAYPILYLASHGEEFNLCLGNHTCDLDELAQMLENRCQYRIVILGSCSTLRVDKRLLKRFLEKTGALAICGYKTDVDWLKSTAFELLLLSELQENEFSGKGIRAIERKALEASKLFSDLDFRIVTVKDLAWQAGIERSSSSQK